MYTLHFSQSYASITFIVNFVNSISIIPPSQCYVIIPVYAPSSHHQWRSFLTFLHLIITWSTITYIPLFLFSSTNLFLFLYVFPFLSYWHHPVPFVFIILIALLLSATYVKYSLIFHFNISYSSLFAYVGINLPILLASHLSRSQIFFKYVVRLSPSMSVQEYIYIYLQRTIFIVFFLSIIPFGYICSFLPLSSNRFGHINVCRLKSPTSTLQNISSKRSLYTDRKVCRI